MTLVLWFALALTVVGTTAILTVLPLKGGWQLAIVFGCSGIIAAYWLYASLLAAEVDRGLVYSVIIAMVALTLSVEMILYIRREPASMTIK